MTTHIPGDLRLDDTQCYRLQRADPGSLPPVCLFRSLIPGSPSDVLARETWYIGPMVHSLSKDTLEVIDMCILAVRDGVILWKRIIYSKEELHETLQEMLPANPDSMPAGRPACHVIESGFLCPGMVDTHTHAPQYPNNGLGAELELLEWLEKYTFPLEKRYADEKLAQNVYSSVVVRTLSAGTTTSCYYATLHNEASWTLAEICKAVGQRALVGKCSMDIGDYSEREAFTRTKDFVRGFLASDTVQPVLTPRFALSCSDGLMQDLGALAAKDGLRVQTHISENDAEIAAVKQRFGCSYAAAYDRFGLLGPRTILAHAVHLAPRERELIKERGCGISHCPNSNLHLNSGLCPTAALIDAGIRVGLGSDCSGGSALGILPQLRLAMQVSRALVMTGKADRSLTFTEAWWMATRGGAEVAGFDVGNFEPGRRFDALYINPKSPGMFVGTGEHATTAELFEKWVWTGDDRDIERVWVDGALVVDKRNPAAPDCCDDTSSVDSAALDASGLTTWAFTS